MCGRYQLALPGRTLANLLDAELAETHAPPVWNAAPTQSLPVVARGADGRRVLQAAEWGLVPTWARRPGQSERPLFNARAETVAEKPAFRDAVRHRRVLVPVTGFYEWTGQRGSKVPHLFRVRGEAVDAVAGIRMGRPATREDVVDPFLLAGIAEVWTTPDNVPGLSFSVLTTTPNELCAPVHDRMPAILDREDAEAWLQTPPEATELLLELLGPFPAERMETWPVSGSLDGPGSGGDQLSLPLA